MFKPAVFFFLFFVFTAARKGKHSSHHKKPDHHPSDHHHKPDKHKPPSHGHHKPPDKHEPVSCPNPMNVDNKQCVTECLENEHCCRDAICCSNGCGRLCLPTKCPSLSADTSEPGRVPIDPSCTGPAKLREGFWFVCHSDEDLVGATLTIETAISGEHALSTDEAQKLMCLFQGNGAQWSYEVEGVWEPVEKISCFPGAVPECPSLSADTSESGLIPIDPESTGTGQLDDVFSFVCSSDENTVGASLTIETAVSGEHAAGTDEAQQLQCRVQQGYGARWSYEVEGEWETVEKITCFPGTVPECPSVSADTSESGLIPIDPESTGTGQLDDVFSFVCSSDENTVGASLTIETASGEHAASTDEPQQLQCLIQGDGAKWSYEIEEIWEAVEKISCFPGDVQEVCPSISADKTNPSTIDIDPESTGEGELDDIFPFQCTVEDAGAGAGLTITTAINGENNVVEVNTPVEVKCVLQENGPKWSFEVTEGEGNFEEVTNIVCSEGLQL